MTWACCASIGVCLSRRSHTSASTPPDSYTKAQGTQSDRSSRINTTATTEENADDKYTKFAPTSLMNWANSTPMANTAPTSVTPLDPTYLPHTREGKHWKLGVIKKASDRPSSTSLSLFLSLPLSLSLGWVLADPPARQSLELPYGRDRAMDSDTQVDGFKNHFRDSTCYTLQAQWHQLGNESGGKSNGFPNEIRFSWGSTCIQGKVTAEFGARWSCCYFTL